MKYQMSKLSAGIVKSYITYLHNLQQNIAGTLTALKT